MQDQGIYDKPNLADNYNQAAQKKERKPTGNKAFDKRMAKHAEAIDSFKIEGISNDAPIAMERPMTDVCWLFIFIGTMVAMAGIVAYGFT